MEIGGKTGKQNSFGINVEIFCNPGHRDTAVNLSLYYSNSKHGINKISLKGKSKRRKLYLIFSSEKLEPRLPTL